MISTTTYNNILNKTRGYTDEEYNLLKDDPSYTDLNLIIIPLPGGDLLSNKLEDKLTKADCTLETRFKCMFSGSKKIISKPSNEQINDWKKQQEMIDEEKEVCISTLNTQKKYNKTQLPCLSRIDNPWKLSNNAKVMNYSEKTKLPYIKNNFTTFAEKIILDNYKSYNKIRGNKIDLNEIDKICNSNIIVSGLFGDLMNTITPDGKKIKDNAILMNPSHLSDIIETLSITDLIKICEIHINKLNKKKSQRDIINYELYIEFIGKLICTLYPGNCNLKYLNKLIGNYSKYAVDKRLLNLFNKLL